MILLPQEHFEVNPSLIKEAEKLIEDEKKLNEILLITDPTHPIGPTVATGVYLLIQKIKSGKVLTTEEIFKIKKYWSPLANNFGIWKARYFLEDTVFAITEKKNHKLILSLIKKKTHVQGKLFDDISAILKHHLNAIPLKDFEIVCRQKNISGIFEKMRRKQKNINHITDFFAFRILVKESEDCYKTLEAVHKLWPYYQDRVKDYIKQPKPNGYQSLHTTLLCLDSNVVEFQIRTHEMDYIAKYGAANHTLYKRY